MTEQERDAYFMGLALQQAEAAFRSDEAPVGAVIVYEGRVISKAHNQREMLVDPTAHAEIIAITQAAEYLQNWRLTGTTIYVTLEPCAMCAGALVLARVDRLVFGARDPKAGACGALMNIVQDPRLNHRVEMTGGVREEEAGDILRRFFARKRRPRPRRINHSEDD